MLKEVMQLCDMYFIHKTMVAVRVNREKKRMREIERENEITSKIGR